MWLSWELLALGTWENELLLKGQLPSLYRLLFFLPAMPWPFSLLSSAHDSISELVTNELWWQIFLSLCLLSWVVIHIYVMCLKFIGILHGAETHTVILL